MRKTLREILIGLTVSGVVMVLALTASANMITGNLDTPVGTDMSAAHDRNTVPIFQNLTIPELGEGLAYKVEEVTFTVWHVGDMANYKGFEVWLIPGTQVHLGDYTSEAESAVAHASYTGDIGDGPTNPKTVTVAFDTPAVIASGKYYMEIRALQTSNEAAQSYVSFARDAGANTYAGGEEGYFGAGKVYLNAENDLIFGLAGSIVPKPVKVTAIYTLEDFETDLAIRPALGGRIETWSAAEPEFNNIRQGKRCIRLTWDLKAVPDSTNCYAGFFINRPTFGRVQKIRAWVYVPTESLGIPITLWVVNSSGQSLPFSVTFSMEGWNQIVFPIEGKAGDSPVISKFTIDKQGSAGYILMDEITIETKGEPRNLLLCNLSPKDTDFVHGPVNPEYTLSFINHSQILVEGVSIDLKIADGLTGKEIFSRKNLLNELVYGKPQEIKFTLPKYGIFNVTWTAKDAIGDLSNISGSTSCAWMLDDASASPDKPFEGQYMMHWGLPGGIFWQSSFKRAAMTGATWQRVYAPLWAQCEYKPGKFDFSEKVKEIDRSRELSLDTVYFLTLYNQPVFYKLDNYDFASAYGQMHRHLAAAMGDRVGWYELGNEDNGPSKFLYTEIARHGAAALRSARPDALIGNSGTAGVDIGWLRMQASRGLFDRLDGLVTHPYTVQVGPLIRDAGYTPEDFGVLEQLSGVDEVIDELGGMKLQYTTEFGYDHSIGFDRIARWLPRHLAIGSAAGLVRHGLFAWDGHFGIYDNGRPLPAAVSVNAFCVLTKSSQFAGWLRKDKEVWVAVFEHGGIPLVMAWSPTEKGSMTIPDTAKKITVRDMRGNTLPISVSGSKITLELTGEPVYVEGLSREITLSALKKTAVLANERYKRLLAKSGLKGDVVWEGLAVMDSPPYASIRESLMDWQPKGTTLSKSEQAVIAQTIRRAILAARMEAISVKETKYTGDKGNSARHRWREYLAKSVSDQVDLPSLRWMLTVWSKLSDEREMLFERGDSSFAAGLVKLDEVFNRVCATLAEKEESIFFSIWPYIYAGGDENGPLVERIKFIPGKAVPVYVRINSYSSRPYEAEVVLDLPEKWVCEPSRWKGEVRIDQPVTTKFMVTAGSRTPEKITAILSVAGKPRVMVPYDNFEIMPAFNVNIPVLKSLLPGKPLVLEVVNQGDKPINGKLRLLTKVGRPIATSRVKELMLGNARAIEIKLPDNIPAPPYNEWQLIAELLTRDGKAIRTPLALDFSAVVKAPSMPIIDADLTEWTDAAPLHLDKEEYTFGSFGSGWSREDLSGTVYTMWDSQYFYIAARVYDQTFQQALEGSETWQQDSIQLGFAPDELNMPDMGLTPQGPMTEIALSLTPQGPQVYKAFKGVLDNAKLSVKLLPGIGAVYECAIPWSELNGIKGADDGRCRFDVLLNDHDVVTSRRVMGRYNMSSIVYGKNPNNFGYLYFLSIEESVRINGTKADEISDNIVFFAEDFEGYEDGQVPDVWQSVIHYGPVPKSVIRSGVGRNGSSALELNNQVGLKPTVYLMLVHRLEGLLSDKKYIMKAWVKGSEVENPGSLGVCSDIYGNEGVTMIPAWKPSDEWQQVQMEFSTQGSLNLIIKNADGKMKNFLIDDIEVIGRK